MQNYIFFIGKQELCYFFHTFHPLRKLKKGLCINLEGWDGEGDGKEFQKGGDICIQKKRVISSVAQSCPTLCDPINRSTPGLPVHHQPTCPHCLLLFLFLLL